MIGIVIVTHRQLGEALIDAAGFILGDKPEAIKYYKKALMIIPDHTKSLQRLEVLQKQKP